VPEFKVVATGDFKILEQIEKIELDAFNHDALSIFNLGLFARTSGLFALVAEDNVVAHALVNLCVSPPGRALLFSVAVEKNSRRKGYGKNLLSQIISRLESAGCKELELTVSPENSKALNLYLGMGFMKTGKIRMTTNPDKIRLTLLRKL